MGAVLRTAAENPLGVGPFAMFGDIHTEVLGLYGFTKGIKRSFVSASTIC